MQGGPVAPIKSALMRNACASFFASGGVCSWRLASGERWPRGECGGPNGQRRATRAASCISPRAPGWVRGRARGRRELGGSARGAPGPPLGGCPLFFCDPRKPETQPLGACFPVDLRTTGSWRLSKFPPELPLLRSPTSHCFPCPPFPPICTPPYAHQVLHLSG